jgi:micrococcal nuclease
VLSVTDGDTIRVSVGGHSTPIRYIGIDTPETVDPRKDVQCFGKEASEANRRLVEGKTVELERDLSETDKYDRLLRYVYVDIAGRGLVMVNEELVRLGFAKSTSYPPDVKYQEKFRIGESTARSASLGLWGALCAAASPAPTPVPTVVRTQAPAQPAVLSVTIGTSRYGLVSATTLAGATCTAQATLPSGRVSTDQDLKVTKTASASGVVSWNYGASSSTNPGAGTHIVTCTLGGVTRSASAPFTVN